MKKLFKNMGIGSLILIRHIMRISTICLVVGMIGYTIYFVIGG